jgi:hypothetical protein
VFSSVISPRKLVQVSHPKVMWQQQAPFLYHVILSQGLKSMALPNSHHSKKSSALVNWALGSSSCAATSLIDCDTARSIILAFGQSSQVYGQVMALQDNAS